MDAYKTDFLKHIYFKKGRHGAFLRTVRLNKGQTVHRGLTFSTPTVHKKKKDATFNKRNRACKNCWQCLCGSHRVKRGNWEKLLLLL